jgi:hypothetical protein
LSRSRPVDVSDPRFEKAETLSEDATKTLDQVGGDVR